MMTDKERQETPTDGFLTLKGKGKVIVGTPGVVRNWRDPYTPPMEGEGMLRVDCKPINNSYAQKPNTNTTVKFDQMTDGVERFSIGPDGLTWRDDKGNIIMQTDENGHIVSSYDAGGSLYMGTSSRSLKEEQEMSKKIEGAPLKFEDWYAANFGEAIPGAKFYMSALKHAYECGVAVEREACAREIQSHASYIVHSAVPTSEWGVLQVLDDMAHTIRARGDSND